MSQTFSSKSSVRILSESLINKIAAGEVVERPSSVVKELLENAIDSGATDIQVTVKIGGKDFISIIDNGCGMNEVDAKLSFERHATSKINNEDDLFNITTLGFRGEALAAISSVSNFELLTCDNQNQSGTRIFVKGGYLEQVGKIGFPRGTKVTVERLFYNTPARQKFLKTTATELQNIKQHLVQKSLSHPSIHFRLTHNNQILLNLAGGGELDTRIEQLFGEELKNILMPVKHKETYLKFEGFVSFPSKPKTSRRWQYIFVNGRNVKSLAINHGIYEGYGTFLGKTQHPVFFINLHLDPSEIDVNVHPAKTEIRFRNSHLVHTILVDQISRFLKDGASRMFFGQDHLKSKISSVGLSGQMEFSIKESLTLQDVKERGSFSKKQKPIIEIRDSPPRGSQNLRKKQKNTLFQISTPNLEIQKNSKKFENEFQINKPSDFQDLDEVSHIAEIRKLLFLFPNPHSPKNISVLAQFSETYIIAENEKGLILFEQRMLLEKIIYEFYMMLLQKKEVMKSSLNSPILLELSSPEAELLNLYLEDLANAGFSISHFGKNTFSIYSIPEILIEDKIGNVIREFINSFSKKDHDKEFFFEEICYNVALYRELNSLKKLNRADMEFLLAKWEELGNPLNSIQGKSMLIKISKEELENLFNS